MAGEDIIVLACFLFSERDIQVNCRNIHKQKDVEV